MQESWEFDFQYPGERPVDAALAELIEAKAKEIGIYLSYYYRGEGGLVERVGLKEGIDFRDPLAGSLKVSFGLVYFNACLNIHDEAEKDEMLLQFEIDPECQIYRSLLAAAGAGRFLDKGKRPGLKKMPWAKY